MSNPLQVVCPHCQTVNRLPPERLADNPTCGRCKAALFSGEPTPVDAASLSQHIEHSQVPVLVDFWAPWCAPCRMMAPEFAKAAGQLEPGFRLLKLDTEAQPQPGARYGIRSIPTLVLFKDGREVARTSGAMPAPAIVKWAKSALGL